MCMPSTWKSRKQHRRIGRAAYKGFLTSGKDDDQDGSGVKEASGNVRSCSSLGLIPADCC